MARVVHGTQTTTGIVYDGAIKIARGKYSFAVNGGAVSTIALMGTTAIPSGAYIIGGFLEVGTQLTSSGSATVAVQVEAANDLVTATAYGSAPWSSTGTKVIIPVFTVATYVKTTAARDISIVIGTAALTAGVFDVVVYYVDPLA